MTAPLPYDPAVEAGLIGSMLLRPKTIGDIAAVVVAGDFYQPKMGQAFAVLCDAWRSGEPLDGVSFAAAHPDLTTPTDAQRLQIEAPSGHRRMVQLLVDLRVRRDLMFIGEEILSAAKDPSIDPLEARDTARLSVDQVSTPLAPVRDLWRAEDFANQPDDAIPWVIPGMFKQGWRVVVVAIEGRGKSWLSRQIAAAAASGIHPLMTSDRIAPVTTLVVDLENPADSITEAIRLMRTASRERWDPDRMFVWHRPGGINLRSRVDRSDLEAVIAKCRPQFVALGPLYKSYTVSARESDEQAAGEVQAVLDDLRTRYGFALLLEHHAPKASSGKPRDILPYGSSLWLRWPELGLKLLQHENPDGTLHKTKIDVERWRIDRVPNRWPDRIDRGSPWPFAGEWDKTFRTAIEEATGLDF